MPRLQNVYREEAEKAGRTVKPGTELALGGQLVLTENPSETPQIMADTRWFWEKWGIPFGLGVAEPLIGDPGQRIAQNRAGPENRDGRNVFPVRRWAPAA